MKPFMFWYNFDTEEYDAYQEQPDDLTPHLPKGPARELFRLHQMMGKTPLMAYKEVLELCVAVAT